MAIFPSSGSAKKDPPAPGNDAALSPAPVRDVTPAVADFATPTPMPQPRSAPAPVAKESIIAADLTIEGKIEGSGDVRIAGRFKGDVNVQGTLTIEHGAKLNGGVRANQVLVSGELDGNIDSASLVELRASAVMTGDLKAGSLTVAAGSKIRGHVECGWGEVKGDERRASRSQDAAASDRV
ncbi:polymer-forming cytoskeletal protein [Luteimonas sp. TWI1416]|uniref:bactofilin family protein n=1 Tax=unclassified Luteimonas TaxID=2629088 RepID=UPI003207AE1F